ncbi:Gamma-tubulin complex component 6 [Phytophthora cinnamomi]|uniref:Gamma-tubulin complex component 6 n=1 Tax=Phytophthora cinnamomi TaxID=4785 RepID=UPI00355A187A|nr:Gamma-tubulin complex component 6 [Phytophthora cinnamomi]
MVEPMPEAGVVELLKRLRCRVCSESRSDLRRLLPVYERLLSPRDDDAVSVQHELMDVRARLLACGDDADVTDVVDRMDHVVERCMDLVEEQKARPSVQAAAPVEEVLRLLVALAGGEDGETFVLEDPMRAELDVSSKMYGARRKRIGDRIQMNDIGLVHHSKALFNKAPIPMEETNLFSQSLFRGFGNGIARQHTSLWCPDASSGPTEDEGFFSMTPFQQPNRFIGIFPGSSPDHNDYGDSSTQANETLKRHHDKLTLKNGNPARMALTSRENKQHLSSSKDVFFYDGTQHVRIGGRKDSDWVEAISMTENSSWDSESSYDATEPWIAQAYAWEDLGDRLGLSDSYCRPPVLKEKRSLGDLVIPNDLSCRIHMAETPLEIHEADIIEDSLRALRGVESTVYCRDFPSATFQLPQKRKLKLRNATISATTSVLELFCKAGTIVMRLELLAIYYSQDPSRGGKTLQAMGDALLKYIFIHRARVDQIAQECAYSFCGDNGEDETLSVTKLLCRTRTVCCVLETVGHMFSCDEDPFWPLLQQGEFPRGVALLDHLHHHVSSLRVEDANGYMEEVVAWFLTKSCSPFLAVLSDLVAFGRDEFEATTWSRNLLEKASAGGGDGLFGGGMSTEVTKMLPEFLGAITPLIVHLSQVQALLRSVSAIALTHPLLNMKPLILVHYGDKAVECAEEWQSTLVEAVASVEVIRQEAGETEQSVPGANSAIADESLRVNTSRERDVAKRRFQLEQRNMLDQQMLDNQQRKAQLAQYEEADDAMRIAEANQVETDQEIYCRGVLLDKYSKLMDTAEERHDYMKWRRDRALRLSTARGQLQRVHADDMAEWATDRERRLSGAARSNGIEISASNSVPVLTEEEGCLSTTATGAPPSVSGSNTEWRTTGVRVLVEPGGSDANVYGALYGGLDEGRTSDKTGDDTAVAKAIEDFDMAGAGSEKDTTELAANMIPCETLSDFIEDEDVVMRDTAQTDENSAHHNSSLGGEVLSSARSFTDPGKLPSTSTRLSLPPVHPFFSEEIPEEDFDILSHALTQTTTGHEANFTSFTTIVNCCVEVPIRLVAERLEKVAVDWLRDSLRIVEHLRWLRKLMLMSEGLCMDIFARDFLHGLNSTTRVNWGIEDRLSSALTLAMIEGSVEMDAIVQSFHYSTTPALSAVLDSLTITAAVSSLLGEIEMVYDVKWPLGLVITSESLEHYKNMHRFLLHVRLTSLETREAWALLRSIRRRGDLSPSLERLCGDVVYKVQALLRAFNESFSTKVLMSAWSELEKALLKAMMLVDLRRCHDEYMAVALRCCFLDTPDIHSAFVDTLAAVWSLTTFIRGLDRQVTGRISEEARIRALCEEYDVAQRALVVTLLSVTSSADRSAREFSECLLLRLNFNDYYSTDAVPAAGAGERVPGA